MKKNCFVFRAEIVITIISALLITIICVIMMIKPNRVYSFEGQWHFDNGVGQEKVSLYENIALPAGVYQMELEYKSDVSWNSLVSAVDGTVYSGGVLTNGEMLHKNLNCTNYRLWLLEDTKALQVVLTYGGEGRVSIGNLTIYETNMLWSLLLTMTWAIALGLIAIFMIRQYDRTVGIDREKKCVVAGLFIIILLASIPFLQKGILNGADLGYHLLRIEGVKDGILSGQYPLRLEPEWLYGHGYANSVFYCNTFLYIPAFFRLLGFTVGTSYKLFCIIINIATAGIAYWSYGKIFQDRYIGVLCSALHTLSIYRLYKFVICGALGESSAFIFLPLILYGFYKAFTEDINSPGYKTTWISIAIGYGGVIQTHVLSSEILAFLTVAVCVIFVRKIVVKQTFLELAKGAMAAVLMSIWYLVPFLDYYTHEDIHVHHVSARQIQSQGIYPAQLFFHWWRKGNNPFPGEKGMIDSDAMGIGLILGLGVAVFGILWFSGRWKSEREKTKYRVMIGFGQISCILAGVFMLMSLNVFPWDKLQKCNPLAASLISSIQFPDRFIGWGTVFSVAVCGCLLWYFKKSNDKWNNYFGIICVVVGIATSSLYLTDSICHETTELYIYNEEGMGYGYISGGEYILEGTKAEQLDYADPLTGDDIEISEYAKKYLHIWMRCQNKGSADGCIDLPLLYYTGYKAYDTATGEELEVLPGVNNVVRVLVPPGFDGEVEVKFVSPFHWRVSEIITYVWWICAVLMCVRYMRRSKELKRKHKMV